MIGVLRPHPLHSGSSNADDSKGIRQTSGVSKKKTRGNAPERRYLAPEGYGDDGAGRQPSAAQPDNGGVCGTTPSSPKRLEESEPPHYMLNKTNVFRARIGGKVENVM